MREFLGVMLILSAFAMFVLSIVVLVKPLKEIHLGSRKRGVLLLVASFVLLVVGESTLPPATPEEIAARAAERARETAEREKANTARRKAREDEEAAELKARNDADAAAEARLKPAMTSAATGLWRQINSTVAGCDAASEAVADAAGARNPSPYVLYPLVQQAKSVCADEGLEVSRLDVPEAIPSRYREGFEEAIETCSNAYLFKTSAFDSMAKVLDGNVRPSAVSDAQQGAERAQAGIMLCGIRFMKAANDAGLDLDEVIQD